jgi:seryl-tRNA synthetase
MLDIKFIQENRDIVEKAIRDKKAQPVDLDEVLRLYEERKKLQQELELLNGRRKAAADERNIEEGKRLKEEGQALEEKITTLGKEFIALMIKIPNVPSPDTPIGSDASGNKMLRQWGEKPKFDFEPKAHWDIGKELDIIDTEKAAEISGARFAYLKGDLALMQFALIQLAFATLTNKDILQKIAENSGVNTSDKAFVPIVPPVMMRSAVMNRMARLQPIEERYYFEKDDMVFVGSAEHTMGPLHMDETIIEERLPIRYLGYSTAFRREAGTYGKDTKGILRVHQFDKLEMESFTLPEHSYAEQDFLVAIQEYMLQQLRLPYQVMIICTGDMGGPDHRQIDIETWMPGQDIYRETHTADLMGGYQARRLNTRVKRPDGKSEAVHMNDATLFAIGRTLIAIIENYQNADGSITIPEVLRPYMGGRERITRPA